MGGADVAYDGDFSSTVVDGADGAVGFVEVVVVVVDWLPPLRALKICVPSSDLVIESE